MSTLKRHKPSQSCKRLRHLSPHNYVQFNLHSYGFTPGRHSKSTSAGMGPMLSCGCSSGFHLSLEGEAAHRALTVSCASFFSNAHPTPHQTCRFFDFIPKQLLCQQVRNTDSPSLCGGNDPFHLLRASLLDPDSGAHTFSVPPSVFHAGILEAQFSARWAILTKCACQGLKLEETLASWHDSASAICSICQVLVTSLEAKKKWALKTRWNLGCELYNPPALLRLWGRCLKFSKMEK